MEKIHLNYDGNQNNGIIFNDKYPNGAMYLGLEFKPNLSFEYDSMQYSEVFDALDYVELNGEKRVMTDEEAAEVKSIAISWVQPLGQEGNPTVEQARIFKMNELNNAFSSSVIGITSALVHEMVSWQKQEDEARAYVLDNTATTPFIDALMITRNLGETKAELVAKIIANADAYGTAYAVLLGKFHNLTKAVELATTSAELEAIGW